jgi:rod shape-determining protein MreD
MSSRRGLQNIVRFILLVLVQVLILNNLNLGGFLNPYVYILFILLLPVDISKSQLLLLSFILGLTIDFFGNTMGLHAAASVLVAFSRPGVSNLFFSNLEFNAGEELNLRRLKFSGFFKYVLVLVFIHNFTLFMLEIFSFNNFLFTLYRIMLNTLLSVLLIFITMFLFSKKRNEKS